MKQLDTQCMICGSKETTFMFWYVFGFPVVAFYCRTCKQGEKILDWLSEKETRTYVRENAK